MLAGAANLELFHFLKAIGKRLPGPSADKLPDFPFKCWRHCVRTPRSEGILYTLLRPPPPVLEYYGRYIIARRKVVCVIPKQGSKVELFHQNSILS
jgi:hypothetical protein